MLTEDQDRIRRAFLRFQDELMKFEEAMKPLEPEMSPECAFELKMSGTVCRSFFRMANLELFGTRKVKEVSR